MKPKTLLIIAIVGVLLAGLAWFTSSKDTKGEPAKGSAMGQKVIPNFALNDVTAITIQAKDAKVDLARQGETWKVLDKNGYEASFDQISSLLKKVWELKVTQDVAIGPSQFSRLNLVSPESPEAAGADPTKVGTLLVFKGEGDKELGRLLLGLEHNSTNAAANPMAGMMGGGNFPNGRYLTAGTDAKTVVLVNDSFSAASTDPKEWLDRTFIRVEKAKTITVTGETPEKSWKLVREGENDDFKLDAPAEGEEFDTTAGAVYKSILSSASFGDVVPPDNADAKKLLEKLTKVEITTFDGFTYKIQIGVANGAGEIPTIWEVSADLVKQRTAPADEKPEDKEAADKAFAENLKKQEEKLAKEQTYSKWIYYVESWTVQALTKPRADLMKKPEPAPGAEGGEGAPMMGAPGGLPINIPGLPGGAAPMPMPQPEPEPAPAP
jgi:hypothetical protein